MGLESALGVMHYRQRNAGSRGNADRGASRSAQVAAQRSLFPAGHRRPDADEREPHAAAFAGAAHGRFRRAHRIVEPQFVSELFADGSGSRATQGTPLALAILQIDRGAEILRQQGESPMERFLEQLARSLQSIVRQNDVAVKYTSWSLAFILPDTTLDGAQNLADKLLTRGVGFAPAVGCHADHAERGNRGSDGEAGLRQRGHRYGLDQSRGIFH